MTMTMTGNEISLGKDFVDAVTGCAVSHGEFTVSGSPTVYAWKSTALISQSESVIRQSAKNEGKRVTYFKSQAIEGGSK